MLDLNENSCDSLEDMVQEEGESRTIRKGGEWILICNTPAVDTDVMSNLKELVADLDVEDIRYINLLLLLGGKRSIKVDSSLVKDLVGDKTKTDVIVNRMKEELDRDFGYKCYDRGPHRRLAVRLPIREIADFNDSLTNEITDLIIKTGNFSPETIGDILSVYLIADESYVRLEPELFFQEVFGQMAESRAKAWEPADGIILGESPQELVELALNKLEGHDIYRDIQLVEAAGLDYSFDAIASKQNERIFLKYLDTITEDDLISLKLFMDAFQAKQGWILTREPKRYENSQGTDTISIMTIKDL